MGGPVAYLRTTHTEVTLIQWEEPSSGHRHGTVIDDQVSGTGPGETISVHSAAFTGNLNGNSVSLNVSGLSGIAIGTLSGNIPKHLPAIATSNGGLGQAAVSPSA